MNKKEITKNLIKDIQDLYSIANRFEHDDQIHQLDFDLALSKVRNLYDLLLTIHPQSTYKPEYQNKEITKKPDAEKEISTQETVVEEKQEPVKEKADEPEFTIEKPLESKEKIQEEPAKPAREKEEKRESKEPPKKATENTSIVADKFQSKKFVHDNITQNNSKNDVSSKMQSKPIIDIHSAIGLNDKFIFIRELFNGDKEQYQETIQLLNNFDTYENALGFLNESFDWDDEDPNFERLKELVKRKFATK